VKVSDLKKGDGDHCQDCRIAASMKHGMSMNGTSNTKPYYTWCAVRRRAFNRCGEHPTYEHVDIDPRWDESFEAFYADMGDPPSPDHSIDRSDNTKGYWPENCRWATREEQARNTSQNRMLTYNGETQCVTDWALVVGMNPNTLHSRLKKGWSVERALMTPVGSKA
jgi:hypothetical protein